MSRYTQSIIVFGLVIPGFLLGVLLGGVYYGKERLTTLKAEKRKLYEGFQQSSAKVGILERELTAGQRRDQMRYWEEKLGKDFIQSLSQNLNDVVEPFSDKQLLRTELSRPAGRSTLAPGTEADYSRLKLSFEGGYGPMQRALAELEIRMPQLVLERLDISPIRNEIRPLKFDITYLCWHDSKDQEEEKKNEGKN